MDRTETEYLKNIKGRYIEDIYGFVGFEFTCGAIHDNDIYTQNFMKYIATIVKRSYEEIKQFAYVMQYEDIDRSSAMFKLTVKFTNRMEHDEPDNSLLDVYTFYVTCLPRNEQEWLAYRIALIDYEVNVRERVVVLSIEDWFPQLTTFNQNTLSITCWK